MSESPSVPLVSRESAGSRRAFDTHPWAGPKADGPAPALWVWRHVHQEQAELQGRGFTPARLWDLWQHHSRRTRTNGRQGQRAVKQHRKVWNAPKASPRPGKQPRAPRAPVSSQKRDSYRQFLSGRVCCCSPSAPSAVRPTEQPLAAAALRQPSPAEPRWDGKAPGLPRADAASCPATC